VADAIGEHVKQAPVKHLDETGCRSGGKTLWRHVASTLLLTFYRVSPPRGDLLSGVIGTIIHGCWKPYFTLSGVLHGLCNAPRLRELKSLREFEKEPWAFAMFRLLRRACHRVNLARARRIELKPRSIPSLFARYDRLVAQGLAFHEAQPPPQGTSPPTSRRRRGRPRRRIGHNLLIRPFVTSGQASRSSRRCPPLPDQSGGSVYQ
jgi:transposase